MTRDEMRDKIQVAIDYLNEHPREARYTDDAAGESRKVATRPTSAGSP